MDDRKMVSATNLQVRQEDEDRFIVCSNENGFETNFVGARIIELCKDGQTLSGLITLLAKEFDALEDQISDDLRVLIPEMIGNKILSFSEV